MLSGSATETTPCKLGNLVIYQESLMIYSTPCGMCAHCGCKWQLVDSFNLNLYHYDTLDMDELLWNVPNNSQPCKEDQIDFYGVDNSFIW